MTTRYRCTNPNCRQAEQFLPASEVVTVDAFGPGALYHPFTEQGSLLTGTEMDPRPLPCGPVERVEGPCRIRLRRRKGWRKPADAVMVTRPGRWGNPIDMDGDKEAAAEWFGVMLDMRREGTLPPHHAGYLYPTDEEIVAALVGRDLACWCPLDRSCHADVLLALANAESESRSIASSPASTRDADVSGRSGL